MDFIVPADYRVKRKGNEKIEKYLDLAKRIMDHEVDGDTSCNLCTWNGLKRFVKMTGRIGNQRKKKDHLDHRIVKIG